VSMTSALFAPSEPAAPGAGSVRTAAVATPSWSLIEPPFNVSDVVAL